MLKAGVPRSAVEHKMIRDGKDPSVLNGTGGKESRSDLEKYRKMLKAGVPLGAVMQRAARDGIDASLLDQKKSQSGAKKKKKEARNDGRKWKKVFWEEVEEENLAKRSIWVSSPRSKSPKPAVTATTPSSSRSRSSSADSRAPSPFQFNEREQAEIATLFSAKTSPDSTKGKRKRLGKRTLPTSSSTALFILDQNRANNLSIMLRRFGFTNHERSFARIRGALRLLDPDAVPGAVDQRAGTEDDRKDDSDDASRGESPEPLGSDAAEIIFSTAPIDEDRAAMRDFATAHGGIQSLPKALQDRLGFAERFTFECLRVPRHEVKIKCLLFRARHEDEVADLRFDLNVMCSACREVMESKALRQLFTVALALGNTLNKGTSIGSASGIKLSSIHKFAQVKSFGGRTTALHYLALVVQTRRRFALNVTRECSHLPTAASLSLDDMKKAVEEMRTSICVFGEECNSLREEGGPESMSPLEFFERAQNIQDELEESLGLALALYEDVKVYFVADMPSQELLAEVNTFVEDVARAARENDESRSRALKRYRSKQRKQAEQNQGQSERKEELRPRKGAWKDAQPERPPPLTSLASSLSLPSTSSERNMFSSSATDSSTSSSTRKMTMMTSRTTPKKRRASKIAFS